MALALSGMLVGTKRLAEQTNRLRALMRTFQTFDELASLCSSRPYHKTILLFQIQITNQEINFIDSIAKEVSKDSSQKNYKDDHVGIEKVDGSIKIKSFYF